MRDFISGCGFAGMLFGMIWLLVLTTGQPGLLVVLP